ARRLLRRLRADAVIGAGGYVSGPVAAAASTLRLPVFLLEADSHMGVTNRMLAPLARRTFLAFPIEGRDNDRYLVTGRPIPTDILAADRAVARARFGLAGDQPCLLVFGGSLGARTINHAAIDAFGETAPCAVLHVSGERDHAEVAGRLEALGSPSHYRLRAYVEPFADALAAADLVVARAGGSVFELAAAGLPAILVPYPHATGDHQTLNARWLTEGEAAVIIADGELDGPRLAREVGDLLSSPGRLRAMGDSALELARPDAAQQIAAEVLAAL
ncbi:MAG: glycosyltransferase, partial [Thermoleophilaceae bacterium]|nr:glycosyltransferase [Thermoleophilaceae bacterium]